jgi:large subunit ribosomal protein L7Ae
VNELADYIKFNVPKELNTAQNELIQKIKKTGKIRVGANEVTKAIERKTAKIVFIAGDVTPPEIVMHLPILCKEKNIPFSYFESKTELGKAAGIKVGTAAIAITEEGETKKELETLTKKLSELTGGKPETEKKKEETKPEKKETEKNKKDKSTEKKETEKKKEETRPETEKKKNEPAEKKEKKE